MVRNTKLGWWLLALALISACGKDEVAQPQDLFGGGGSSNASGSGSTAQSRAVILDGRAEVALNDADYDSANNCIQLYQAAAGAAVALRFAPGSCGANGVPSGSIAVSLTVGDGLVVYQGSRAVGKLGTTDDGVHLFDLCTRDYAGCTPQVQSRSLKAIL